MSKWFQKCNYAQGVEGDLDTTHVSFMHRTFGNRGPIGRRMRNGESIMNVDGAPVLTTKEADHGFSYGARRKAEDGAFYWRVTQFLLPFYSMIPSEGPSKSGGCWIPIDDHNSMGWRYAYNLEGRQEMDPLQGAGGVPRLVPGTYIPVANAQNDYLVDRQVQKTFNYTGNVNIREQDLFGTETMGPIMDRTKEHLGTADSAVILMRRQLMRLARQLQAGQEPYAASRGDVYHIRALDVIDPEPDLGRLLEAHKSSVWLTTV